MPTTRHRVNLTLTEAEELALQQLTDPRSPHGQVLRSRASGLGRRTTPKEFHVDAELIHHVLAIGLAQIDEEASAASYAAEAAHEDADRRAAVGMLQRNLLAKVARQERERE